MKQDMQSHRVPSAAPKTVIDKYRSATGSDWAMHEAIGADFVSIPMLWITRSNALLRMSLTFLIVEVGAANLYVHLLVTRRIRVLTRPTKSARATSIAPLCGEGWP